MTELPPLEETCPDCAGRGEIEAQQTETLLSTLTMHGGQCAKCHGTGQAPTRDGLAILQLLRNHGRY